MKTTLPSGRSVAQARKDARRLSRAQGIPLHAALNQVAANHGAPKGWDSALRDGMKSSANIGEISLPFRPGEMSIIVGQAGSGTITLGCSLLSQILQSAPSSRAAFMGPDPYVYDGSSARTPAVNPVADLIAQVGARLVGIPPHHPRTGDASTANELLGIDALLVDNALGQAIDFSRVPTDTHVIQAALSHEDIQVPEGDMHRVTQTVFIGPPAFRSTVESLPHAVSQIGSIGDVQLACKAISSSGHRDTVIIQRGAEPVIMSPPSAS